MDFYYSSWKYCPDTVISTRAYIIFYQNDINDHVTHVPGPVAQPSAESKYNVACTEVLALLNFRLTIQYN